MGGVLIICGAVIVGVLDYLLGYWLGRRVAEERYYRRKSPAARYGAKMSYEEWQEFQELNRQIEETFGGRTGRDPL